MFYNLHTLGWQDDGLIPCDFELLIPFWVFLLLVSHFCSFSFIPSLLNEALQSHGRASENNDPLCVHACFCVRIVSSSIFCIEII